MTYENGFSMRVYDSFKCLSLYGLAALLHVPSSRFSSSLSLRWLLLIGGKHADTSVLMTRVGLENVQNKIFSISNNSRIHM